MKIKLAVIILAVFLRGLSAEAQSDISYQAPLVPAPPQSTVIKSEHLQSQLNNQNVDTEIIHYISPQSAKEIVSFYKRTLKGAGWEVLSEIIQEPMAMISLSKDNRISANITARNQEGAGSEIYVSVAQTLEKAIIPDSEMEEGQFMQFDPAADAAGRDPIWAPRYPGTVRKMYREDKQTGQVMVVYAAADPVEEVVRFYTERMSNSGWWLKDNVDLERIPGFGLGNYQNLVFENGQADCVVSVNRPENLAQYGPANKNLTAILLTYSLKR
ncbi:MAG: hypothetical protein ISS43_01450 [Candidatus Omnitrophica bacterium]|nr:hypothetical protein [Candidatus Omnitrophota bacterium]